MITINVPKELTGAQLQDLIEWIFKSDKEAGKRFVDSIEAWKNARLSRRILLASVTSACMVYVPVAL